MICCPVVVTGICLFSYVEYQVDFVLVQQQPPPVFFPVSYKLQNKCYVCILSPANFKLSTTDCCSNVEEKNKPGPNFQLIHDCFELFCVCLTYLHLINKLCVYFLTVLSCWCIFPLFVIWTRPC